MMALTKEIKSIFQAKTVPNTKQLVEMDGLDALDKEGAVNFFSGKSSNHVLEHLRSRRGDALAGADYQLEEWSVLKAGARYYYLRAYLQFLLETLSEDDPDGGYVSDFFHQLYQTVFMYGTNAYSVEQEVLLQKIAAFTREAIRKNGALHDSSDDIVENIDAFLTELKKHG